jgi:hypothetical protein
VVVISGDLSNPFVKSSKRYKIVRLWYIQKIIIFWMYWYCDLFIKQAFNMVQPNRNSIWSRVFFNYPTVNYFWVKHCQSQERTPGRAGSHFSYTTFLSHLTRYHRNNIQKLYNTDGRHTTSDLLFIVILCLLFIIYTRSSSRNS